jgi:hypothetical protein
MRKKLIILMVILAAGVVFIPSRANAGAAIPVDSRRQFFDGPA